MTSREKELEKAIDNIRKIASMHFLGGAFMPEHMRAIANYCIGLQNGEPLPEDLDEAPEPVIVEILRENGWTHHDL